VGEESLTKPFLLATLPDSTDALGSVRRMADPTGALASSKDTNPMGM